MKNITKILLISLVLYSILIGLTLYLGGGWYTGTVIGVLGLGYDVHSYLRLRKGKSIFTYRTLKSLIKNKRNINETLGEKRF